MCGALRNYFYCKTFSPHVVDHNHVCIWRLALMKLLSSLVKEKGKKPLIALPFCFKKDSISETLTLACNVYAAAMILYSNVTEFINSLLIITTTQINMLVIKTIYLLLQTCRAPFSVLKNRIPRVAYNKK